MHPTGGYAPPNGVNYAQSWFGKDAPSRPAHQRVTQTVGIPCIKEGKERVQLYVRRYHNRTNYCNGLFPQRVIGQIIVASPTIRAAEIKANANSAYWRQ